MRTKLLKKTLENLELTADKIKLKGNSGVAEGILFSVREIKRVDKVANENRSRRRIKRKNGIMHNTGTL